MRAVLTPPTMGGTVAHMTHTENIYSADEHAYLVLPGVILDRRDGIEFAIDQDQADAPEGHVALLDSSGDFVEIVSTDELRYNPRWTAVRRDDAPRVSLATAAERLRRSGQ